MSVVNFIVRGVVYIYSKKVLEFMVILCFIIFFNNDFYTGVIGMVGG